MWSFHSTYPINVEGPKKCFQQISTIFCFQFCLQVWIHCICCHTQVITYHSLGPVVNQRWTEQLWERWKYRFKSKVNRQSLIILATPRYSLHWVNVNLLTLFNNSLLGDRCQILQKKQNITHSSDYTFKMTLTVALSTYWEVTFMMLRKIFI